MKTKTNVRAGTATFHDLSFTHNIDKASPVLMQ
jgi:type VI protein secretion system component Hcp